jgi:hypothetical protein
MGEHEVLSQTHIGGSGFLVKRSDYVRHGPVDERLLSRFWIRLAVSGRINGWYHPLIFQEHMDDPRSSHCALLDAIPAGGGSWITRSRGIRTRRDFEQWIREDARRIQVGPSEVGLRARISELWGLRGWARRTLRSAPRGRQRTLTQQSLASGDGSLRSRKS